MFFTKKSPLKKKLEQAKELLHHAKRIYNYRRDVLESKDVEELVFAKEDLSRLVKEKDISLEELSTACTRLEKIANRTGGHMYPVKFIPDNVETILVAAILAIGIRTFFFQPFMIPTNSMYPTYAGMLTEVYQSEAEEPSFVDKVFRKVFKAATHYEFEAPVAGEVRFPLNNYGWFQQQVVPSRKWFGLLPDKQKEYYVFVGDTPMKIRVPMDFWLEEVIQKRYYPQLSSFKEIPTLLRDENLIEIDNNGAFLKTGVVLSKGEDVLNFDILGGDMLFVNRLCYHFVKPKIGDPIVFRTENIKRFTDSAGNPIEKYFIKRLVGVGGDTLSVEEPNLIRNGEPISGVEAFKLNQAQAGDYPGYIATHDLAPGKSVTIPQDEIYAMGDNSPDSQDSRYWGSVSEKELIGRAGFIFYPFTHRWGLAK